MRIDKQRIKEMNDQALPDHREGFDHLDSVLGKKGIDVNALVGKLKEFQVAVPSWALGTGGTRFGRFPGGGEPGTLEDKIADVGLLHQLSQSAGAISLHIPWDIPKDVKAIKELAASHGLIFDAVNSNTFQDQPDQELSYKFGSLCHADRAVRKQAVDHNLEVIRYGDALGSKSLTVWLADGSSFPGQLNFKKAFRRTLESLQEIYAGMPSDWKMFVEYKPYEPNFYSTVIQDWGTSHMLADKLGDRAYSLVDLGHHLPNTNIEQIVATLMMEGKLGGFHFNDSKYGDDDVTVGSLKPYQLFLIFNELVDGMEDPTSDNPYPAWMIDASHNLKDPLEDLLQSLEAIKLAYAQALLVDRVALEEARENNDPSLAQEILQAAYRTDVRPLLAEARLQSGGALDPIGTYRRLNVRKELIAQRGEKVISTGL
ncbi:sugar isomerase [Echinicola strongylocentroti]|uniref:Sugar isomerase n=1 Tax=Echinicola strongylocentroti TaxID=1795355 RepID=A0A2Z4IKA6_9BACT|nr:TIM barrel protein [Echinicola strongylocentroti]AWW31120.1 sugar isomerase [Echinicola strongylocentroti]